MARKRRAIVSGTLRTVAVVSEVDELDVELACEQPQHLVLGDVTELDQRLAELASGGLLFLQRDLELLGGDDTVIHEQIADTDLLA